MAGTPGAFFEVALLEENHTSPTRQRGAQVQASHKVASNARAPRWRVGLVFALANSREKHASATSKSAGEGVRDELPFPTRPPVPA